MPGMWGRTAYVKCTGAAAVCEREANTQTCMCWFRSYPTGVLEHASPLITSCSADMQEGGLTTSADKLLCTQTQRCDHLRTAPVGSHFLPCWHAELSMGVQVWQQVKWENLSYGTVQACHHSQAID